MPRLRKPDLARLYHLNSSNVRPVLPDLNVDHDRHPQRFRTYAGSTRISLPGRDHDLEMPLGEVIRRRASGREFRLETLPLVTLGRMLYNCYGVTGTGIIDGEAIAKRPVPSGGALYPLEMYIATQNVEAVADGIYHYDARDHELEARHPGTFHETLAHMTLGQTMIASANVVVLMAAISERTMWKYGQRGYRYVFLEAGHVGQNMYLAGAALGLSVVAIGGFFDAEVNELCRLPAEEEVIYMMCVGQPAFPAS